MLRYLAIVFLFEHSIDLLFHRVGIGAALWTPATFWWQFFVFACKAIRQLWHGASIDMRPTVLGSGAGHYTVKIQRTAHHREITLRSKLISSHRNAAISFARCAVSTNSLIMVPY